MPPLYRIDHGQERRWAWDDAERDRVIEELGGRLRADAVTRFKGLGEMNPDQLRETAMDSRSRILLKVLIEDDVETDRTVNDLMGKDASARYRFVMEGARDADDLDI